MTHPPAELETGGTNPYWQAARDYALLTLAEQSRPYARLRGQLAWILGGGATDEAMMAALEGEGLGGLQEVAGISTVGADALLMELEEDGLVVEKSVPHPDREKAGRPVRGYELTGEAGKEVAAAQERLRARITANDK